MSVEWEASREVIKFRNFWKGCCNNDSGGEGHFCIPRRAGAQVARGVRTPVWCDLDRKSVV